MKKIIYVFIVISVFLAGILVGNHLPLHKVKMKVNRIKSDYAHQIVDKNQNNSVLELENKTDLEKERQSNKDDNIVYLLDFEQGDLPNDTSGDIVSLTDEKPRERKVLKVIFPAGKVNWIGQWQPKMSNWSDYECFTFEVYNPTDEVISLNFLLRDEIGPTITYPHRYDDTYGLRPGWNKIQINLSGLMTNDKKRKLEISQIKSWNVSLNPKDEITLYFDNFFLIKASKELSKKTEVLEPVKTICRCEKEADLTIWEKRDFLVELSNEFAKEGNFSIKVTYPADDFPGLSAYRTIPSDWSNYEVLKVDIYNPQDSVINFGVLIKDEYGDAYPDRYDGYFALKPGWNDFALNITGLMTNDKKRKLEMTKIKQLIFFLFKPDKKTTLYFDDVRLKSERQASKDSILAFDFGTENSPLWPGFTKVTDKTVYSKETGYGWEILSGLMAQDRQHPDALFRDWVRGGGPFIVDLPNGEYTVYMMLEDPGYWEFYQHYDFREVYANGELKLRETMDSETFYNDYYFKHLNTEDLPGEDVWDIYIKPRYNPKIFKVKVDNSQLRLNFNPGWGYACTLSCLIIYPVTLEKDGGKFIEDLNRERKEDFERTYIEVPHKELNILPEFNEKDKKIGYILFVKNYLEKVYPNSLPQKEELKDKMEIFAAKGEYEPATFCIYPLRDLGESEITVSDLISNDGFKISKENIDMRSVQYKLKRLTDKTYEIRGELLGRKNKVVIKKGITRQFWLTVKIPEEAQSGDYQSKILFEPENGEGKEIYLKVKVLPFKLLEPDIAMGMFYFTPAYFRWFNDKKEVFWNSIKEHFRDLKEHNINTLAVDIWPRIKKVDENGQVELDFSDFDIFVGLYKDYGFKEPIVNYGIIGLIQQAEELSKGDKERFTAILKNAYKAINEHIEKTSGLKMVYGLADEVSNVGGKGIDYAINIDKIAHQVPGIKTTAFLNSPKDEAIFPYLDVSIVNNGMKINQELIDKIKNSGSECWFYNIGANRFTFGFYLWKVEPKGRLEWNYQLPAVDPYYDLDGRESDYCASYPSIDGPINSVWFEWVIEGIDDYRYLKTLEYYQDLANNKAKNMNKLNIKKSWGEIDNILKDIRTELSKNKWSVQDFENNRRKIIKEIVGFLQK